MPVHLFGRQFVVDGGVKVCNSLVVETTLYPTRGFFNLGRRVNN